LEEEKMKSLRILELVGVSLAIMGSFLPWEREGDILSYQTYGIRLFPMISDYGGSLVVLLAIMIFFLILKPPRFINNPGLWNLILSSILMAMSLVFMARGFVHHFASMGVFGAATLEIGLISVVVGSALIFSTALPIYPRGF
jgi:hypothetical protein